MDKRAWEETETRMSNEAHALRLQLEERTAETARAKAHAERVAFELSEARSELNSVQSKVRGAEDAKGVAEGKLLAMMQREWQGEERSLRVVETSLARELNLVEGEMQARKESDTNALHKEIQQGAHLAGELAQARR